MCVRVRTRAHPLLCLLYLNGDGDDGQEGMVEAVLALFGKVLSPGNHGDKTP